MTASQLHLAKAASPTLAILYLYTYLLAFYLHSSPPLPSPSPLHCLTLLSLSHPSPTFSYLPPPLLPPLLTPSLPFSPLLRVRPLTCGRTSGAPCTPRAPCPETSSPPLPSPTTSSTWWTMTTCEGAVCGTCWRKCWPRQRTQCLHTKMEVSE